MPIILPVAQSVPRSDCATSQCSLSASARSSGRPGLRFLYISRPRYLNPADRGRSQELRLAASARLLTRPHRCGRRGDRGRGAAPRAGRVPGVRRRAAARRTDRCAVEVRARLWSGRVPAAAPPREASSDGDASASGP